MASTFDNDLRLEEMATGENAGSWGTKTNTNLELIADAFGYGTFTIANADTTLTMPDGSDTDNALRSLYLKISSSADLTTTRTLTLAPNSVSKLWYIENNTSGGQTITISQGSGANVSILNGQAKLVATDGGLATAAVIDLTDDLAIKDLFVDENISMQSDGAAINFGTDAEIQLTHVADTGLLLTETGGGAPTLQIRDSALSISSSADGQLDIDADTEVEIVAPTVDIDASTAMTIDTTTLTVTGNTVLDGDLTVDTDTLYVDSTNNNVGIGLTTPTSHNAGAVTLQVDGGANASEVRLTNDTTGTASANGFHLATVGNKAYVVQNEADDLYVYANGGEVLRINSSQQSIFGASANRQVLINTTDNTNATDATLILQNNTQASTHGKLFIASGTTTPTQNLGLGFVGFGDSNKVPNAFIGVYSDGATWTTGSDMPTRMAFWTTADGAASATERVRIDSNGLATFYYSTKNTRSVYGGYTAQTLENSNTNAGILTFTQQTWNSANGVGYIRMENSSATDVDSSEFTFHTGDLGGAAEAMRIDSSRRVLIGTDTARSTAGHTSYLQVEGSASFNEATVSIVGNENNSNGAYLNFGKSRGTTAGSNTIVQDGDVSGQIQFSVADGTDMASRVASITAKVDGTPDLDDTPGLLDFATTAVGAFNPTLRMRITSGGFVGIAESNPQKLLHVHANNGQGVAIFEHNYSYSQDNWAIKFQNDNVNSYMGANDGASRAWEVRTNGYYFGSGLYWLDSGATNSGAIAIEEASGDINFYASNSLNSANNFTPQSRMRLLAADQSGGESALLIGTAQTAQTSYNELLKVQSAANNGDGGITISSYRPQLNFIDNSGGAEDFRMWNDSAQFNFNKNGDSLLTFDAYGRLSGQDSDPSGASSTQRGAGSIYVKGIGTPWILYQASSYWIKMGEIEFTNGSAFGYAFRKLRINGTGATNGDYAVGDLIINYKQQGTGTYQTIALHNTKHFDNRVAYLKTTGGAASGADLIEFWILPYTTYTEIEVHNIQDSTGGVFSASGSTGFRFSMVSTGSATQPSGSTLIATSSYPDT